MIKSPPNWGDFGGYGSVDLLPYIDYNRIKETPKLFLGYSDGTSILNAIYANTGITTYYGQTPGLFANFNEYDRKQFVSHLIDGDVTDYISNSDWYTITGGFCEWSGLAKDIAFLWPIVTILVMAPIMQFFLLVEGRF